MGNFLVELKDIAVGRETSFGVVGTISEWVGAKKAEFNPDIPNESIEEMVGQREVKRTYVKSTVLNPSLGLDVDPESGLGVILRTFFGTVADAVAIGTLAYKHTFTMRASADSDSMFARYTQFGTVMKNYVGLVPSKLSFDYPKDDNVTLDASFVGMDERTGTNTTGTHNTLTPFLSTGDLAVHLDGTISNEITNIKVNIENGAKGQFTLGTFQTISKVAYGKVMVDGSFDIFFNDENERNKFINKTALPIKILSTGATISGTGKYEFNVIMPKAEYTAFPIGETEGIVGASVTFKAFYGANATGTGAVIIELQNSKASY